MRIPKLFVLITVYAMCAIGLAMLWNDRRNSQHTNAVSDEGRVPAYK